MLADVLINIVFTMLLVLTPIWYATKKNLSLKGSYLVLWGIVGTVLSGVVLATTKGLLQLPTVLITGILSTVFNFACLLHPEKQKIYFRSIFVIFLFFFITILQYIPVILFHIDLNSISLRMESYLSLFSNTCLLMILLFLYRKDLIEELRLFKKDFMKNIDIGFRYWFLGLIVMMTSNLLILFLLPNANPGNEESVQALIQSAPIMSFLSTAILAPIIEEITFRKTFRDLFENDKLFIWVSGLIFGGLHVFLSISSVYDLAYLIPYCSLGISFGYIYAKTKTVGTSMFMHLFHNIVLTLLSIVASMVIIL